MENFTICPSAGHCGCFTPNCEPSEGCGGSIKKTVTSKEFLIEYLKDKGIVFSDTPGKCKICGDKKSPVTEVNQYTKVCLTCFCSFIKTARRQTR